MIKQGPMPAECSWNTPLSVLVLLFFNSIATKIFVMLPLPPKTMLEIHRSHRCFHKCRIRWNSVVLWGIIQHVDVRGMRYSKSQWKNDPCVPRLSAGIVPHYCWAVTFSNKQIHLYFQYQDGNMKIIAVYIVFASWCMLRVRAFF